FIAPFKALNIRYKTIIIKSSSVQISICVSIKSNLICQLEKVFFQKEFESIKGVNIANVMGERVPEGGGSYGAGSVTPGSVLGPEWWSQEVGIRGAEAGGGSVVVEQVSEVGGGWLWRAL
ncbi:hypothetical protein P7M41_26040, partial [Vibrio parahaemolyticus]|nr:hypothetical protein [Vibrio parahaemolyticus]